MEATQRILVCRDQLGAMMSRNVFLARTFLRGEVVVRLDELWKGWGACGSQGDYCSACPLLSKTVREQDKPLSRFAVAGEGDEKERRNQSA